MTVSMRPYDVGSGPEMACPSCEWCWGADGQPLNPLDPPVQLGEVELLLRLARVDPL